MKLEIITGHLTEKLKILILSLRNITLSYKIITFSSLILILSLVNITFTSALSYESNIGVGFTFNPTLSINISSSDLVINNLTPGTMENSNSINVSVATNAAYGYTLSTTTNSNNLIHNDNNVNSTFSSIANDADLETLTADNTWGYSYKLSNGSNNTWSSYNGLSTGTNATLINTDNQTSKPIDFKIAAKASSTQPSGIYTGTINFIAISKPIPRTIEDIAYMQTFGELNPTDLQSVKNSMILNQDYILKDSRDEKEYYITRLEDGNVWMTQNLDLDLSHDIPLTSEDTDLNDSSLSGAYDDGYTLKSNTIEWTPASSTIDYSTNSKTFWQDDNDKPYSLDIGAWYWDGDDRTSVCNFLNSSCAHFSKTPFNNNHHLAIGNYYNWSASIASNDSSTLTSTTYNNPSNNPKNSICPKGWRLPMVSNQSGQTVSSTNEFSRINYLYNNSTSNDASLIIHPIWFVRAGLFRNNGLAQSGYEAVYWSSTIYSSNYAYSLYFRNNLVIPNYYDGNGFGRSVRCLAR